MKRHTTKKEVTKAVTTVEEVTEGYYLTREELSRIIKGAFHCGSSDGFVDESEYVKCELAGIDYQAEKVESYNKRMPRAVWVVDVEEFERVELFSTRKEALEFGDKFSDEFTVNIYGKVI